MAKKTAAKAPETLIDTSPQNEASRIASGFDPTNWHAAIHLQCRVRDVLQRPVSLADALGFAASFFADDVLTAEDVDQMRHVFDTGKRIEEARKDEERQRIAATAGQR